jgi:hypothetical protein
MGTGDCSLHSFGTEKIIRDITLSSIDTGSWLAIIGTPLISFKSPQAEQAFLAEFLDNPAKSMQGKIDGSFAVFAYDAQKKQLIAATDFNNTTPYFYSRTLNGIVCSSHELPLAKLMNPKIDSLGFSQSIYLGVTWGSRTRFREISKALPCEILTFSENGDLHKECYWSPCNEQIWSGGLDGTIEKWSSLLKASVLKFHECSGGKPSIADFTAGEDSRLLVAQCHSLGIPFTAQVEGLESDVDVLVAKQAAATAGFALIERRKHWIGNDQLLASACAISLGTDAYQGFLKSCSEFATNLASPFNDYKVVKYCGVPGGEAFRGSYYLRGKAIFPSKKGSFDYKFFTKMKYLLDYYPGLFKDSDEEFLCETYKAVEASLEDVKDFPVGTKIDHILRIFQTCFLGLKYKSPLYLPFATKELTRSIYSLHPRFKQGGKLTKACTEVLFPELACVRTQNGVPTIRKTLLRTPLFMPEYLSLIRKVTSGALSRLLKLTDANKWYYNLELNSYIFRTLFNSPPYSGWFGSSDSMVTGYLYNPDVINPILESAKAGKCECAPILENVINQELALRWVYGKEE